MKRVIQFPQQLLTRCDPQTSVPSRERVPSGTTIFSQRATVSATIQFLEFRQGRCMHASTHRVSRRLRFSCSIVERADSLIQGLTFGCGGRAARLVERQR